MALFTWVAVAGAPLKVDAEWFSCRAGRYAVTLPKHYPSLHGIGRHRIADLETRHAGGEVVTRRRIQYYGLRLDVLVFASDPTRYTLVAAEATSRRWHLGRLSVGEAPWRWFWSREKSLAKVALDGPIELVGRGGDTALLEMRDGRIDRLVLRCLAPH